MDKPRWVFVLGGSGAASAWTLLRVVVGAISLAHGIQKLLAPDAFVAQLASLHVPLPVGTGRLIVIAETIGGLGMLVGLLTALSGFVVATTLLVEIVLLHAGHASVATYAGFESLLTPLTGAVVFIVCGAGPFSLDALRSARAVPEATLSLEFVTVAPHPGRSDERALERIDSASQAGIDLFFNDDDTGHSRRLH